MIFTLSGFEVTQTIKAVKSLKKGQWPSLSGFVAEKVHSILQIVDLKGSRWLVKSDFEVTFLKYMAWLAIVENHPHLKQHLSPWLVLSLFSIPEASRSKIVPSLHKIWKICNLKKISTFSAIAAFPQIIFRILTPSYQQGWKSLYFGCSVCLHFSLWGIQSAGGCLLGLLWTQSPLRWPLLFCPGLSFRERANHGHLDRGMALEVGNEWSWPSFFGAFSTAYRVSFPGT